MNKALVNTALFSCVEPAVYALAVRLFVLTTDRDGSSMYKPTVATFFETGIITAIYEHLLMLPSLAHLEIRHEMPYHGPVGAPRQVDLWIRPPGGGYAHLIEAGDFSPGKVHRDLAKIKAINPNGANWFLAFFRKPPGAANPTPVINQSFLRVNGLDDARVEFDARFSKSFEVYRPNGAHDPFGFALFRAR